MTSLRGVMGLSLLVSASAIELTGNARDDFGVDVVRDLAVVVRDGQDVSSEGFESTGWDVDNLYFYFDPETDALTIGVECFGICGDADGDGDAGRTSAKLNVLGGEDVADMGRQESFALAIDFNLDVADVLPGSPGSIAPFDFIVGVPSEITASQASLPCAAGVDPSDDSYLSLASCFGLYEYTVTADGTLGSRFAAPVLDNDGNPWSVDAAFVDPQPGTPDLEFVINDISELRRAAGASDLSSMFESWSFLVQGFSGSPLDHEIGDDFIPEPNDYAEVTLPCREFDACGECLGDNSTCSDCFGEPNGEGVYDGCGDCRIPNSPDFVDGDCLDCQGNYKGEAEYDTCGDCFLPDDPLFDQACSDCLGDPNGVAEYDLCGVCNGTNACADCAGTPYGDAFYDQCGDCRMVGEDDIDSTCKDCAGVVNGDSEYDQCGECGIPDSPTFGMSCVDCAGTAFGDACYDECGDCNGDNWCLDCEGTPFGDKEYDSCGDCGGDGSACACLSVHGCEASEVDFALLEWSLVATAERIDHSISVLEGLKEELCHYDVSRGALSDEISAYLDTANEFRSVLDNFAYVQLYFKDTLDEAVNQISAQ